jgi:hypothetical protein
MYSPDEAKAKVGRLRPTSYWWEGKVQLPICIPVPTPFCASLLGVFVVIRFISRQVVHVSRRFKIAVAFL